MSKRNKLRAVADDAIDAVDDIAKDVKKKASRAKKKGFVGRMFAKALVLSAVGSAVAAGFKYFTDSSSGAARRQKVLGLVGATGK